MTMTLKDKQTLFVNELTFDFLDTLRYVNGINRNRQQSQSGVVQNLGNRAIGTASAGASLIPGASSVPGVLRMAWNFSYNLKYEERYSVVNADVIQHLETTIYDAVKKAAICLSLFFRDFLDTKMPPKGIKVLADCIADRMMNHMSKVANVETPASFWSAEELMRGAFEGISGRWKKTVRNTALETEETLSWWQEILHHHIATTEGLMTHTAFATKENDQWVFYANKMDANPLGKYGLAIFSPKLAQLRVSTKGRQGEQYQRFEPNEVVLASKLEQMEVDWITILTPIELTPTESNETLSAKQAHHEASLTNQELRIMNFEEALTTMGISMEALQQEFLNFQGQQAQSHEVLQVFLKEKEQQLFWQDLTEKPLLDEAVYHLQVEEWLEVVEKETDIPAFRWLELFMRAALADYTYELGLDFSEWEATACTLSTEDVLLISKAPNFFPLEKAPLTEQIQWNTSVLKHYFLSLGLWQLYQVAQQQPIGTPSAVWRELSFIDPEIQRFLKYWMPQAAIQDLLLDWQTVDELSPCLKLNIETLFAEHSKDHCACYFCAGRKIMAKITTADALRVEHFSFLETSSEIRWMRLLPMDRDRNDFHAGFSPHQPRYVHSSKIEPTTFQAVAWHWSEQYLSDLLWDMLLTELEFSDGANLNHIVALVPASINQQMMEFEAAEQDDLENHQLLHDQSYYIQNMLQLLTLEDPEDIDANRWFATYEEALMVQSLCHDKIKQKAKNRYQAIFHQPCTNQFLKELNSVLDEESPLLDAGFLALQDGERMGNLPSTCGGRISENSNTSILELQKRHRDSAYKEKGQSRKNHLNYVNTSWKNTLKMIKQHHQELEDLSANRPLDKRWIEAQLNKEEVVLLLTMLIEALHLRELVIRNYIQGSSITQPDFTLKDWRDLSVGSTVTSNLLKRKKTSAGTSPLEINRDDDFSEQLTLDGFKPAATPYEVWTRAQLLHNVNFWFEMEKKYKGTALCKKGNPWSEYKVQLERVIDKLPSLKPILEHRLGRVRTHVLVGDLQQWKRALQKRKEQLEERLSQYRETQRMQRKERHFHALSHQMRFEKLLMVLPPIMKKAYQALGEEKQQELMDALRDCNRQSVAEWFCRTFNDCHPVLFWQTCHKVLNKHFIQTIPSVGINLTAEEHQLLRQYLKEGRFDLAYQLAKNPTLSQEQYFKEYQTKCQSLLTEFHDTRAVWESWSATQKEAWLLRIFQGDETAWPDFLTAMEGRWYPLTQSLFKSFLCQGLHPDASFNGHTLVNLAIDHLYPEHPIRWNEDYVRILDPRLQGVYYLLDSDGITQNWPELLRKTRFAYQEAHSNEKYHWLHLAAALLLFQAFQAAPEKKTQFLEKLLESQTEIVNYWNKFTEEEQSWWSKILGPLYRTEKVRKNRADICQRLKAYVHSIPFTISHLYAFFELLNQLSGKREKQHFFENSRLNKLIGELHQMMSTLLQELNIWQNMHLHFAITEAQSKQWVLGKPAELVEIPFGNTYQVVSPLYTQLAYQNPEERVAQIEAKGEKALKIKDELLKEKEGFFEERKEEVKATETEGQMWKRLYEEEKKKNAALEKQQALQGNPASQEQPELPSFSHKCTIS